MKAADIRDENWLNIQRSLKGNREKVYQAFLKHGPHTTKDVASMMPMSLLTVRPRATELYKLGLLELVDREGHEGVYKAIPLDRVYEKLAERYKGEQYAE